MKQSEDDSSESDRSDSGGSSCESSDHQNNSESQVEDDDNIRGSYDEVDGGSSSWDSFAEGSFVPEVKLPASIEAKKGGGSSSSSPPLKARDAPVNNLKEIVEGETDDDIDDGTDVKKRRSKLKNPPLTGLKDPPPTEQSASDTPQTSVTEEANSSDSNSSAAMLSAPPTEEDLERIQEELQATLEEENMLIGLQMQLTFQLEQLQSAITSAESEDRIARLAIQQAKTMRLSRKMETGEDFENEEIIINVG